MTQIETILIIESDIHNYEYLNNILKTDFNILYSKDGLDGIKQTKLHEPSLILCSVDVKKISCFLYCSIIQECKITADIPIIIVTEKYSSTLRTFSFKQGIDNVINLQINSKEIIALVRNCIDKRRKLKNIYRENVVTKISTNIETHKNKIILNRIENIVNSNMTNPKLDVTFICMKMGSSRSVLQSKIKKITGKTLGNYVRNLKLNKAEVLLRYSNFFIYEISELTGFNSIQSFIKAFKRKFILTPLAYRLAMRSSLDLLGTPLT